LIARWRRLLPAARFAAKRASTVFNVDDVQATDRTQGATPKKKTTSSHTLATDVTDQKSVRNFNGRTLRFVASALTPARSTQPMLLSLY
jgi:hypothetical protein